MEEYRASVEAARIRRTGDPVLANWSNDHASVILENLFLAADRSVKIVTNCLAAEVYDQDHVLSAARAFLQKQGTSLEILLETDVSPERPFMRLIEDFASKVFLAIVPPALRQTYSYNFCVADDDCYRFEENRQAYNAIIQFGNPVTAARILTAFDKIKSLALAADPRGRAGG